MSVGTPVGLGSNSGNSLSSTIAMTGIDAAIGDYLVIAVGCFGTSAATATVADGLGNTYTPQVQANSRIRLFTCRVTNTITTGTITGTYSSSETARHIQGLKVTSGMAPSSEFDQSSTGTAGGTTAAWTAGSIATPAQADTLAVAACTCDTVAAATDTPAGTPATWTELFDVTNGGAFQMTLIYQILTSVTSVSGGGTWTSSGWTWNAAQITVKGDGGGVAAISIPQVTRSALRLG